MWNILKVIVFLTLIIIVTTFAVQNQESVGLNWYFNLTDIRAPLYLLLYGCIIGGIVIGISVGGAQRLSLWKKNRDLEKKVKKLEEEHAGMNAAPQAFQEPPPERGNS